MFRVCRNGTREFKFVTCVLAPSFADVSSSGMKPLIFLFLMVSASVAWGTTKIHLVTLGKSSSVQWMVGPEENRPSDLKIRALSVDGKLKEYTTGPQHEVTERLFVVRRMFRLNDSLPQDGAPRWKWQRGGWLLVDRVSGKVSPLNLPDFDNYHSSASWYRDYAAYCGLSDDSKKAYAIVAQVGRRKPLLKKALGDAADEDMPDRECPQPTWQRQPARVSFEDEGQKTTYSIRGHAADILSSEEDEEDAGSR